MGDGRWEEEDGLIESCVKFATCDVWSESRMVRMELENRSGCLVGGSE